MNNADIFIVGGASLMDACLDYIDAFLITNVLGEYTCDVYIDMRVIKELFPYVTYRSKVYVCNDCMYFFEVRINCNLVKNEIKKYIVSLK